MADKKKELASAVASATKVIDDKQGSPVPETDELSRLKEQLKNTPKGTPVYNNLQGRIAQLEKETAKSTIPAEPVKTETVVEEKFPSATYANLANAKPGDKFTNSKGVTFEVTQEQIDDAKAKTTPAKVEEKEEVKETTETSPAEEKTKVEETTIEEKPSERTKKATDIGKYLGARSVVAAYKDGEFGEPGSKDAKRQLGYYILDAIGTTLLNTSAVARGASPTEVSKWEQRQATREETARQVQDTKDKLDYIASIPEANRAQALKALGIPVSTPIENLSAADLQKVIDYADRQMAAETEQKELTVKALSQEQRSTATANLSALQARKIELQKLIADLEADRGWDSYRQAMEAYVGTARGLESSGLAENVSDSISKGNTIGVSAGIGTGGVLSKVAKADISGNASWNNSSTSATGKQTSLSQDALALSKYADGDTYGKETREARVAANQKLIENLRSEIAVIDAAINQWGKDLGITVQEAQ